MLKFGPLRIDRQALLPKYRSVRVLNYVYELVLCRRRLDVPFGELLPIIGRYGQWSKSIRPQLTPVELGLPWMVYDSVIFLEAYLRPGDLVFEYGSGGSTVFFTRLGARGVSIEHDAVWADRVRSEIERSSPGADWEIRTISPNTASADPLAHYRSSNPRYLNSSFVDYVSALSAFPANHFALVAVDGRARNACIVEAAQHVALDGYMLVDNSDRLEYREAIDRLEANGWVSKEFNGPLPAGARFSRTTLLRRPHR